MFNESKAIALAIYSITLIGVVVLAFAYGLEGSISVPAHTTFLSVSLMVCVVMVYFIIFVPKFLAVADKKDAFSTHGSILGDKSSRLRSPTTGSPQNATILGTASIRLSVHSGSGLSSARVQNTPTNTPGRVSVDHNNSTITKNGSGVSWRPAFATILVLSHVLQFSVPTHVLIFPAVSLVPSGICSDHVSSYPLCLSTLIAYVLREIVYETAAQSPVL